VFDRKEKEQLLRPPEVKPRHIQDLGRSRANDLRHEGWFKLDSRAKSLAVHVHLIAMHIGHPQTDEQHAYNY
jgi:hypothetical protein